MPPANAELDRRIRAKAGTLHAARLLVPAAWPCWRRRRPEAVHPRGGVIDAIGEMRLEVKSSREARSAATPPLPLFLLRLSLPGASDVRLRIRCE